MRKAAQEKFKRADTLMGILRDAGVDPADAPEPPADQTPTETAAPPEATSTLFGEIKAVFTTPERRRDFVRFLKNGLRP